MKPICVPCQRFYRPVKNGYTFIEGLPTSNNAPPGTLEPENWKPYKLWIGDLWECPTCHHQTISGVPRSPIAEHYQPDFTTKVNNHSATLQINDC